MAGEKFKKAACNGVFIPGKQGRLFATVYNPAGEGPFPVAVLCHGFPGNERLLGFADYLRDKGIATVHFHYSGSWGSDGDFSFDHCMDDLDSVLSYVEKDNSGIFDCSRLFVLGHSLGGLVASRAVSSHPEIAAAVLIMPGDIGGYFDFAARSPENESVLKSVFEDCGQWLHGYSWDTDLENAGKHPGKYHLGTYAEALSCLPVLFIAGSDDPSPLGESDIYPLYRAVVSCGTGKAVWKEFKTDHCMNENRQLIKDAVADFLASF